MPLTAAAKLSPQLAELGLLVSIMPLLRLELARALDPCVETVNRPLEPLGYISDSLAFLGRLLDRFNFEFIG